MGFQASLYSSSVHRRSGLCRKRRRSEAEIDLLPDFTENELTERVRDREGTYEEILGGFYHAKVLKALLRRGKSRTPEKKQFRRK